LARNKLWLVWTASNPSSFAAAGQAAYSCTAHRNGERLRKGF